MSTYDVVIVGGGLAGLVAAKRLQGRFARIGLLNHPVPNTPSALGGFARFSGAKFSLFPAGSGLAPVAGGERELQVAYEAVLDVFAESGIGKFSEHRNAGGERAVEDNLRFRQYHSILLTPDEMTALLEHLRLSLSGVDVSHQQVVSVNLDGKDPSLTLRDGTMVTAGCLIFAAGRLGADMLAAAGVPETDGKGLDVGVRVEFEDQSALRVLRSHGADAKFLDGPVRTFCLNSPGTIFHYPAFGVQVPGGVVADPNELRSNVGLLRRLPNKRQARSELIARLSTLAASPPPMMLVASGDGVCVHPDLRHILSDQVCEELNAFAKSIGNAGLIDWPASYRVHFPLIDWHWPVFGQKDTLRTQVDSVFAIGDLSGHARGLLQAATSGWLCVDEIAR